MVYCLIDLLNHYFELNMKTIIGIIIILLVSLFIFVAVLIWKRVKKVIIEVRDGNLKSQLVSKIIKKAETTGRIEYTIYRPVMGSIIFSFIYLFINYLTNTYFIETRPKANDFLFTFLFMFVVWSIIGIIVSHKIWNLCREE